MTKGNQLTRSSRSFKIRNKRFQGVVIIRQKQVSLLHARIDNLLRQMNKRLRFIKLDTIGGMDAESSGMQGLLLVMRNWSLLAEEHGGQIKC
jgi:hypothetical protein